MRILFSTTNLRGPDKFRRWRDLVASSVLPVDCRRDGDRPFEGKVEQARVGLLTISRTTNNALLAEASGPAMRRHKAGIIGVGMKIRGTAQTSQDDWRTVTSPGDIVLLADRSTVVRSSDDSCSLYLELERERLERMLGPASLFAGLRLGADMPSTALAVSFFKELLRLHDRLSPEAATRVSSIGIDLIVASLAERMACEVPASLHGTVLVQRAKAYIEAHLDDPTLGPATLAAAMRVSLRSLQAQFHERGRHISDWIWQRRVEVAAGRLADPGFAHLPIGTLALGCGFTSQAHFSRRFRSRFGLSPLEHRREALRPRD